MEYLVIPILAYAAVKDGLDRMIPNCVGVMLILAGLINAVFLNRDSIFFLSVGERMIGFIVPFIILFLIYIVSPQASGGGDLKLICTMGFCVGLPATAFILLVAATSGAGYGYCKKMRSIPFAPFLFVGSISYFLWRLN